MTALRDISIRTKLIAIFIVIKVVPLILLAWIAWQGARSLGFNVSDLAAGMARDMRATVTKVGEIVAADSVEALDDRSREAIERLTTDTAQAVANFLYQRDSDVLYAATLAPDPASYRHFLESRLGSVTRHGAWAPTGDGKGWRPATPTVTKDATVASRWPDNSTQFHSRRPEARYARTRKPLFLEMTFVGLDGREKVKVATADIMPSALRDVSRRQNTWVRAETYFAELRKLRPGDIYVSNVIGAYVGTPVVGPYTPAAAKKQGIPFAPEAAAYAGRENPLGKRFRGLIRWATPVARDGRTIGYVTLALGHRLISSQPYSH